ncbi:fibronectin type III-like domain-contianing protein [Saccharopolyspora rosea]|uniref:Fibronectin type III-like domain-contianing protein n=1 Tax=Saccharopolyspora rosea TaxID=524884 RepID=A0ABW3FVY8_9PSEU
MGLLRRCGACSSVSPRWPATRCPFSRIPATRWLASFSPVHADAGAIAEVVLPLPRRAFADWQDTGWHHEPGTFDVLVGPSVLDLPLRTEVELTE